MLSYVERHTPYGVISPTNLEGSDRLLILELEMGAELLHVHERSAARDPPQPFSVDIYRIGHYGGEGAAKITTSPRLSGIVQPSPLVAERTVSCHHWWLSWRLQVPTYWQLGAYVAVLTTA